MSTIVADAVERILSRARTLLEDGSDEDAALLLEGVPSPLDVDLEADTLSLKGDIASASGDLDVALTCYEEALVQRPAHTDATVGAGKIHLACGSPEKAEGYFASVLIRDPDNTRALVGLALVAQSGGDYEDALRYLNWAFATSEDQAPILEQIIEVALESGNLEPALGPMRDFAARHPDDPAAACGLATLYFRLGSKEQARSACDRVLELDPTHEDALAMRAELDGGSVSVKEETADAGGEPDTPGCGWPSPRHLRDAFLDAAFIALQTSSDRDTQPWVEAPVPLDCESFRVALDFVIDQGDAIHRVTRRVEDAASRRSILDSLLDRVTGHRPLAQPDEEDRYHRAWELARSTIRELAPSIDDHAGSIHEPVHRFELRFAGASIRIESVLLDVVATFYLRDVYLERPAVTVRPEPGDVVIDGGAHWGASTLAFAASVGTAGRVIAVEPEPGNLARLRRNVERNPELARRISSIDAALAGAADERSPIGGGAPSRDGTVREAPGETVDRLVERESLERVDLIKLDVGRFGAEVLAGAATTIRRCQPKLAIATCGKLDDLIRLPRIVDEIDPAYRLYVSHVRIGAGRTVIFAAPGRT